MYEWSRICDISPEELGHHLSICHSFQKTEVVSNRYQSDSDSTSPFSMTVQCRRSVGAPCTKKIFYVSLVSNENLFVNPLLSRKCFEEIYLEVSLAFEFCNASSFVFSMGKRNKLDKLLYTIIFRNKNVARSEYKSSNFIFTSRY